MVADHWDRTIERFLAHLSAERGLSRHTVSGYRRDLRRLADYLRGAGQKSTSELRREDVEEFLAYLSTGDGGHVGLAPASVARALAAVRAMLAFEVEEGRLPEDPSRDVPAPVLPRRLPKAITYAQVVRLFDAAHAHVDPILGLRDSALLELLYGTGARISELTSLDIDDVPEVGDPDGLGMLMLSGKGGKERLVPFGRAAQDALAAYLVRARPSLAERGSFTPALFLNARGGRLSRQNAYLVLQRAAERADLGVVVSPHTLRHSFATHLLDGGADVRVVQELLGHASVTTTQIYTLITPQRMLEEYRTSHPRARAR